MATSTLSKKESASKSGSTLSKAESALIDAYWRAANYLSVGQIYLFDNPLLREPLKEEHIKPRLLGHWGTTPGLNFIYVAPQPAHQEARSRHDLHHRSRTRRTGVGRQYRISRGLTAKSIQEFRRTWRV